MIRYFRILRIKINGKYILLQRVHRNIQFQRMYNYVSTHSKGGYFSDEDYINFMNKVELNYFNSLNK